MNPDWETARLLCDWILAFDRLMDEVRQEQWLLGAYHALLGLKPLDTAALVALKQALALWSDLHRRGGDFELKALVCHDGDDPAFDKALEDLAAGRKPFGVFSMFKGGLKAKIDGCGIEGRRPKSD